MAQQSNIPVVSSPKLIDRVIVELQQGLMNNLDWLDNAFGRAQRVVKEMQGKAYIFPACFSGGEDYVEVSPDSNIGNFSFVQIGEPQNIDWIPNQQGDINTPFSLIFWFDLRTIFPNNYNERNTEAVKAEILKALSRQIKLTNGKYVFRQIWEKAENIYRDYPGVKELDNQFLMHPFGGFRFDGVLTIEEAC